MESGFLGRQRCHSKRMSPVLSWSVRSTNGAGRWRNLTAVRSSGACRWFLPRMRDPRPVHRRRVSRSIAPVNGSMRQHGRGCQEGTLSKCSRQSEPLSRRLPLRCPGECSPVGICPSQHPPALQDGSASRATPSFRCLICPRSLLTRPLARRSRRNTTEALGSSGSVCDCKGAYSSASGGSAPGQ
jgi:hypothetical protein